jgi:hypothetical protein
MLPVLVAVLQRQERQDRAQLQRLAVQVMTHQHLEAKLLEPLIMQVAVQVAARQAVALQQARQRAQQTVQQTAVQVAAETVQQDQTTAAQVAQEFC